MIFAALPALADQTDVLYQHKSWMVEGVTFDDGTYACLAEVTEPGEDANHSRHGRDAARGTSANCGA